LRKPAREQLPDGLTKADWEASATVRDLRQLDKAIAAIRDGASGIPRVLVDLGCGMGGLTRYVGDRLGFDELHGIDLDEERLAIARGRGVETRKIDLNDADLPFADDSVGLVTSFGAFEHFVWYDAAVREASRILSSGGYFLISQPNLANYLNRFALLLGYQPRDVEVSKELLAGVLPPYKREGSEVVAHVHSATLRAMRELLDHYGFDVTGAWPFSPYFDSEAARYLDMIFGWWPSISRRYIIVGERR
jgi:SAM-dependent methyltransferase